MDEINRGRITDPLKIEDHSEVRRSILGIFCPRVSCYDSERE